MILMKRIDIPRGVAAAQSAVRLSHIHIQDIRRGIYHVQLI